MYVPLLWLIFPLIGSMLANKRGKAIEGFLLGLILGPIGCVYAPFLKAGGKLCPQCAERVRAEARNCRYCGMDLSLVKGRDTNFSVGRACLLFVALMAVFGGVVWYQDFYKPDAMLEASRRANAVARQTATPIPATPIPSQVPPMLLVENYPLRQSTPTPPPKAFLLDVQYSQQAATLKYPALAVKGSAMNTKFVTKFAEWKDRHDARMDRSDWPEKLAAACAGQP